MVSEPEPALNPRVIRRRCERAPSVVVLNPASYFCYILQNPIRFLDVELGKGKNTRGTHRACGPALFPFVHVLTLEPTSDTSPHSLFSLIDSLSSSQTKEVV